MKQSILVLCVLLLTGAIRPAGADVARSAIPEVQRRVVKIFGAGGLKRLEGYGTGFLVSAEGHIATVWSHVLDADRVTVVLDDGGRFTARVVGADAQLDLAVLKLDGDHQALPYFDLEHSAEAAVGMRVLAFSNMFQVATGEEPVSVMHGVVAARTTLSARRGAFPGPYRGPVYIVDAVTNNVGAAGGVLTTRDGRLLGMLGKELREAGSGAWINYTMPIGELKDALRGMIAGTYRGRTQPETAKDHPQRYAPIDFGLVLVPDVVTHTPAYVLSVLDDSPAAKAGVRADDLVVLANDVLVQSVADLRAEIGRLEFGDTLRLALRRGEKLVTVEWPVDRRLRQSEPAPRQ